MHGIVLITNCKSGLILKLKTKIPEDFIFDALQDESQL
jgi:hypothetical protein